MLLALGILPKCCSGVRNFVQILFSCKEKLGFVRAELPFDEPDKKALKEE